MFFLNLAKKKPYSCRSDARQGMIKILLGNRHCYIYHQEQKINRLQFINRFCNLELK